MTTVAGAARDATTTSYVALLRGINVGGRNKIRMADLTTCFESGGFEAVSTYIQSGNVLFRSDETDTVMLATRIERMLAAVFDYDASVAIRSQAELRAVIERAPQGFGSQPDRYRYDVIFLLPPLTAAETLHSVTPREGVDTMAAGPEVVYTSRLIERASQSRLTRVIGLPIYQRMTIRNWNTTTKLLALMGDA